MLENAFQEAMKAAHAGDAAVGASSSGGSLGDDTASAGEKEEQRGGAILGTFKRIIPPGPLILLSGLGFWSAHHHRPTATAAKQPAAERWWHDQWPRAADLL